MVTNDFRLWIIFTICLTLFANGVGFHFGIQIGEARNQKEYMLVLEELKRCDGQRAELQELIHGPEDSPIYRP